MQNLIIYKYLNILHPLFKYIKIKINYINYKIKINIKMKMIIKMKTKIIIQIINQDN